MPDMKPSGIGGSKDLVCVDTYRVLDSCRDKDCFEDVRVYLTEFGQQIIERTNSVRVKGAHIEGCNINIEPVPFNRGFYQLDIRMFAKVECEACVSPGNVQALEGIAAMDKKVILFGSEGNVSVFKSTAGDCSFCPDAGASCTTLSSNLPVAVLETVDPIVLGSRVVDGRSCVCRTCCGVSEIPRSVSAAVNGELCDFGDRDCTRLLVTFGLFSVVRMERPAQYLICATDYCVPDKICRAPEETDPCSVFREMDFPVQEFAPPSLSALGRNSDPGIPRRCSTCGQTQNN